MCAAAPLVKVMLVALGMLFLFLGTYALASNKVLARRPFEIWASWIERSESPFLYWTSTITYLFISGLVFVFLFVDIDRIRTFLHQLFGLFAS